MEFETELAKRVARAVSEGNRLGGALSARRARGRVPATVLGLVLAIGAMPILFPAAAASPGPLPVHLDVGSDGTIDSDFGTIQAAVDAASSGDTVLADPATYDEMVTIGTSGIVLRGSPGAILDGTGLVNSDGIRILGGVSHVTIRGFEIRKYVSTAAGVGNGIQAWNLGTSHVTVKDNVIHDNSWNGILVGNEGEGLHSRWKIKENTVYDNRFVNIELTNGYDSSIKENTVTGCATCVGGDPTFDGILVQARNFDYDYLGGDSPAVVVSRKIVVEENTVVGPYFVAGIDALAVAGGTVGPRTSILRDVKIVENEVSGTRILARGFEGTFGGTLFTSSTAASIKVAENDVHDSPAAGITFSRVSDSQIKENRVNNNERGIVLAGSHGNKVAENTVNDNANYGIRLIAGSTGNTIKENTATGNGLFDLFHDTSSTPNLWKENTCGTKSGSDIPSC